MHALIWDIVLFRYSLLQLTIKEGIINNLGHVPSYYAMLIPDSNVYFFIVDRHQLGANSCPCPAVS